MQKFWWYIKFKFGDLAIKHQSPNWKCANVNVTQMSIMAIHTKNAKLNINFNPIQFLT